LLSAIDLVNEVSGSGSVAGVVNPGQPSRGNAEIETHTLTMKMLVKMMMMVIVVLVIMMMMMKSLEHP